MEDSRWRIKDGGFKKDNKRWRNQDENSLKGLKNWGFKTEHLRWRIQDVEFKMYFKMEDSR